MSKVILANALTLKICLLVDYRSVMQAELSLTLTHVIVFELLIDCLRNHDGALQVGAGRQTLGSGPRHNPPPKPLIETWRRGPLRPQ